MVVRMRHTRSHTKNRRSHHALKGARLTTSEGGVKHPRHKALLDGSQYRGRSVGKVAEAPKADTQVKVKEEVKAEDEKK